MSACFAKLPECQAMFTAPPDLCHSDPGPGVPPLATTPPARCLDDATKFGALASPTWCQLGEYCDRCDNNNNGKINESTALVDVGTPCTIPGLKGFCAAGKTACSCGQLICQFIAKPTTEDCNGIDDDCDGIVDNVPAPVQDFITRRWSDECNTGLPGICGDGRKVCTNGAWKCVSKQQPMAQEICNNMTDDNCNGEIDESPDVPAGQDCLPPMLYFYMDHDRDGWPTNDKKCLCKAEGDYVIPATRIFNPMSTYLDNSGNLLADCCDKDPGTNPAADYPDVAPGAVNAKQLRNACSSYDLNCDGIISKEHIADDSGCSFSVFDGCGGPSHTYHYTTPDCGGSDYENNGCGSYGDRCPRHYDVLLYQQCK